MNTSVNLLVIVSYAVAIHLCCIVYQATNIKAFMIVACVCAVLINIHVGFEMKNTVERARRSNGAVSQRPYMYI